MIEQLNPKRLQLIMRQAKAILVSLIPALVLLAALDYFGDALSDCRCEDLTCLTSSDGHGKHGQPAAHNSFNQAVQRWSRRVNLQPISDGVPDPSALTLHCAAPTPADGRAALAPANLELAQAWQFFWRTASPPRAPSSVS